MRAFRSALAMVLFALLAAAPVRTSAEVPDCGPDCIALLFAPDGDRYCIEVPTASVVTAHLVLIDPSFPELVGIGFRCELEGPVTLLGVTFGGPVICETWEPLAYCHAWSPPLAVGPGGNVLAELTFIYLGAFEAALIGLDNWGGPGDGQPWAWLDGDIMVPLAPLAGPGRPLAQINGTCGIVRAQPASWSTLKCLYR
jgi:hypothetical protein